MRDENFIGSAKMYFVTYYALFLFLKKIFRFWILSYTNTQGR